MAIFYVHFFQASQQSGKRVAFIISVLSASLSFVEIHRASLRGDSAAHYKSLLADVHFFENQTLPKLADQFCHYDGCQQFS